MIVVVGSPAAEASPGGGRFVPSGLAAAAAVSAVGRDAIVQLVGKLGEDEAGDQVLVALSRAGVGHVAVLRDAGGRTPVDPGSSAAGSEAPTDDDLAGDRSEPPVGLALDAADLDLAFRYLTDFAVIVACPPHMPGTLDAAAGAARWAGARLIAVLDAGEPLPDGSGVQSDDIVLARPPADPEGAFGRFVGELAAAIDAGESPADAFAEVEARIGLTRVGD